MRGRALCLETNENPKPLCTRKGAKTCKRKSCFTKARQKRSTIPRTLGSTSSPIRTTPPPLTANQMSNFMFRLLEKQGIPTHFVEELSERETAVKRVTIVPLEVIVRNKAAGSLSKRLGLEEGTAMRCPVLEFSYKNDDLGDPMVNDYHILAMGLATREELDQIAAMSLKINQLMVEFFKSVKVDLIDFKLEFGKTPEGDIILADEISPDTCRFWDADTGEKLDKDRFRRDMGGVEEAYAEMMKRLGL